MAAGGWKCDRGRLSGCVVLTLLHRQLISWALTAERPCAPPQRRSTVVPHALIIEDEYWLAIEMKEALKKLGYATSELASSMAEAIAAAERRCPDLIVADQMIVGGTGTEAILTICSEVPIPVVFVTGSGAEVRGRLPDVPLVDKPFSLPRLHEAIEQAVERPFCRP